MSERFALRDAVHAALGSPPILPSTSSRVEMAFEALEEMMFERGVEHVRKHAPDVEESVGAMLDILEEKEGRRVFDRAKFDEALAQVNATGRRGSLNPLHQKPLAFEKPRSIKEILRDPDPLAYARAVHCGRPDCTAAEHPHMEPAGHEAQPMPEPLDEFGDPLDRSKHDSATRRRRSVHGVICCPCCLGSGVKTCGSGECCTARRRDPYYIEYNKPGEGPIAQAGRETVNDLARSLAAAAMAPRDQSLPDWHCGSAGCGAKSSAENPCAASPAFAKRFLRT